MTDYKLFEMEKGEWVKVKDIMVEGYLQNALESWIMMSKLKRHEPNPVIINMGELRFRGQVEVAIEKVGDTTGTHTDSTVRTS